MSISSAPAWTASPAICNLNYAMTVSPTPPSSGIFQFNQATMTVSVFTNKITINDIYTFNSYSVEVRVTGDDPADTGSAQTFAVEIANPCFSPSHTITTPASPLSTQSYYIGGSQQSFDI